MGWSLHTYSLPHTSKVVGFVHLSVTTKIARSQYLGIRAVVKY